jgi:hypothetical protein
VTILLLAALLGVQDGGQDKTLTLNASVRVPVAIGPAIRPYVDCLGQRLTEASQAAGALHADGMRKIVAQVEAECSPVRAAARKKAIRLIASDKSVARGDRAAVVDRALADIDQTNDSFVDQIEQAEKAEAAGFKP